MGFNAYKTYGGTSTTPGTYLSENKIDITYFSTINIQYSIAKGGYISDKDNNVQSSNIIHSFQNLICLVYSYLCLNIFF